VSATPAIEVLARACVAHRVRAYDRPRSARSPASGGAAREGYALEAAAALGVDPARVFKTLLAVVEGRAEPAVVALVPATGRLDLRTLAVAAGGKRAELADAGVAERLPGYVVGAISPLGQRRALPTFADVSLADWPSVLVSAGRRGLEVELAPEDLLALTGGSLAGLALP
jgi:Cys-tRNA(Pro)/Cys-tRNA(Cys) deacylase